MTTVPALRPATEVVLDRLADTGLIVGDGRKPDGAGWQGAPGTSAFVPYVVLYPIGVNRQGPDSPLSDRGTDPVLRYQVTAVGKDRRSAEGGADLVATALLTTPLTLTGLTQIDLVHETSLPATRDEAEQPPLFYCVDRFRLDLTTT